MEYPKKVLISGVGGQTGSYMAELCLELGLSVYGIVRNLTKFPYDIKSNKNFTLIRGDLLDKKSLDSIIEQVRPHYIINLAAQSFIPHSFVNPEEVSSFLISNRLLCSNFFHVQRQDFDDCS